MTDRFADDTRVMTLRGEVRAADLRPGELLLTLSGQGAALKPLLRATPAPVAAPIRIRAGAIAEGCPRRDLLLDAAHPVGCLGGLVPVGLLVNGATVTRDDSGPAPSIRLELAAPDILLADGLAAGIGQTGAPDPGARAHLRERALALGWSESADPGLRVLADGVPADPDAIPPAQEIRLLSRSAIPGEIDPAIPDGRRIGVALAGLWLDDVPRDLDHRCLAEGFLSPEPGLRWTDGDALIRPPCGVRTRLAFAPIWTRYWVAPA